MFREPFETPKLEFPKPFNFTPTNIGRVEALLFQSTIVKLSKME